VAWASAWLSKYNAFPAKPPASVSVARRRAAFERLAGSSSGALSFTPLIQDLRVGGRGGRHLRVYSGGAGRAPAPLILYLHGGGWHVGSLTSHDHVCRRLAAASRCAVAALDYRLAPEHRAPAAVDDAVAAARWLQSPAAAAALAPLAVQPRRLALAGDSAGANVAVAAALALRGDAAAPAALGLIYPALDLTLSRAGGSLEEFGCGYYLHRDAMQHYVRLYLRGERWAEAAPPPGALDAADPRVSPLLADDAALAALPPTFVSTAGCDPLRDDGELFAQRLKGLGVAATLRREHALPHVWLHLAVQGGDDVVQRTHAIGRDIGRLLGADVAREGGEEWEVQE